MLDKDLYRPGDSLYARLVILNGFTHRPLPTLAGIGAIGLSIEDAKGSRVCATQVTELVEEGVCGALLRIPQGANGGAYRLVAKAHGSSKHAQLAPTSRAFSVREFHKPSLSLSIQFVRQGYCAGNEVVCTVSSAVRNHWRGCVRCHFTVYRLLLFGRWRRGALREVICRWGQS